MTEKEVKKFSTPKRAWKWFEKQRWPDGPVCPHCQSKAVTRMRARERSKSPARFGLHCCQDCYGQFTVTKGTFFEDHHLPLYKWFQIFCLMSRPEGTYAHEIHKQVGVTYRSAWKAVKRLRSALNYESSGREYPKKIFGTTPDGLAKILLGIVSRPTPPRFKHPKLHRRHGHRAKIMKRKLEKALCFDQLKRASNLELFQRFKYLIDWGRQRNAVIVGIRTSNPIEFFDDEKQEKITIENADGYLAVIEFKRKRKSITTPKPCPK